jgi:chromosome segregation ATPase
MENKKKLIAGIVGGIVGLALIGAVAYLYINLDNQRKENKAMQELAELDKKEMENEYQQFANQYSEMRMQISNDSIIAQLTAEQEKTEKLLKELKETKTNDAREIARLKKELATVRAILRNYVIEIDSLNRLNHNLTEENSRIKGQYNEATRQIEGLNTERASLSEKVAIAAQLDATGISMQLKNKRGKSTNNTSKCKSVQVNFPRLFFLTQIYPVS